MQKTLINPMVVCSLEDGDTAWNARATVRCTARVVGTPNETGFTFTWDNNAVNLTDSTANAVRINYWITQVSDTGVS
jgi:hypothetical protein